MKLQDFLSNVGRAVAYHPNMARFLGSVNAAIFFAQIYYWQDKCTSDLGVYKTAEEIEEETGLTYREQLKVRKSLVEQGFLIETRKRLEYRIYFRFDMDKLHDAFCTWSGANSQNDASFCALPSVENEHSLVSQSDSRECHKVTVVNKTEITAEITTEKERAVRDVPVGFVEFWMAYPNKRNKQAAIKAFARLKPSQSLLQEMMHALAVMSNSDDWKKMDGRFVPHASTWINNRRWEDVQVTEKSTGLPDWCAKAGFPHIDVARANGCVAANAHLFSNGEFYKPEIPTHKRLGMREAI